MNPAESSTSAQVAWFFVLTFAISWGAWLPIAADEVTDSSVETALTVVGVFGPLLAAAIVTKLSGGSIKEWLRPALNWRVHPRWYVVIFGLPLLVLAVVVGGHLADGGELVRPDLADQGSGVELPLAYLINVVALFFVGGGQEEPGWRGFALPRLLERFDGLTASLILGAVWAVWHLPLFSMGDTTQADTSFIPYFVGTLGLSVLFTWLYLRTKRSLFVAMAFHATLNVNGVLDPVEQSSLALQWLEAAVLVALAIVVVAIVGPTMKVRSR